MVRLAVPVNLHIPPEPTKNLAKSFKGINDYVTGINVRCSVCKMPGRDNSKIAKRRGRVPVVCADCQRAT